jgi:hypothetical protein
LGRQGFKTKTLILFLPFAPGERRLEAILGGSDGFGQLFELLAVFCQFESGPRFEFRNAFYALI